MRPLCQTLAQASPCTWECLTGLTCARSAGISFLFHSTAKISSSLLSSIGAQYGVRNLPIRKDDEVRIVRGTIKNAAGSAKVIAVYRKKWVIHIDKVTKDRANTQTVQLGIHPSNVVITKLKMDRDRKAKLEKTQAGAKGKYEASEVAADNVD